MKKTVTKVKELTDLFDSDESFREEFLNAVENLRDLEGEEETLTSWVAFTAFFKQVDIASIRGVVVGGDTIYPLAEYGWDGGNAIETVCINITNLVRTDILQGPMASLVKRTDPNKPGIAIHNYDSRLIIQVL